MTRGIRPSGWWTSPRSPAADMETPDERRPRVGPGANNPDDYAKRHHAKRRLEESLATFHASHLGYQTIHHDRDEAVVWHPGSSAVARLLLWPLELIARRIAGRPVLIRDESFVRFVINDDHEVVVIGDVGGDRTAPPP